MTGALILITTKVGAMKDIHQKIQSMNEIEESSMMTGPYDIMAIARADEMSDITNTLIENIRSMEGVEDTITNIFIE